MQVEVKFPQFVDEFFSALSHIFQVHFKVFPDFLDAVNSYFLTIFPNLQMTTAVILDHNRQAVSLVLLFLHNDDVAVPVYELA